MTTGNYVRNNMQPWTGGGSIGTFYNKIWSGTDDPPLPIPAKEPPSFIYRAYLGDIRNVKKIRVGRRARSKRHRQHVDMHEYHMSTQSLEDQLGSYVYSGTTYQFNSATHRIGGMGNISELWTANDQIKLINKLKEKVQGSDFNLAIFLGEGHQTLEMIADSAIRIAKSIHHIRKGDLAGSARALFEGTSRRPLMPYKSMKDFRVKNADHAASRWLELQYGWMPLISDVESGMHFIAHKVESPWKLNVQVTRRLEKAFARHLDLNSGHDPGMNPFVAYTDSVGSISYGKTLRVVMTTKPPSLAQQLGLLDPLSLLWELTPFSFVVDWFIPVGQFLSANSFFPGATTSAWESIKQTSFQTFVVSTVLPQGIRPYQYVILDRQPASLTVPLPNFKGFGKAASWQHAANAVALVIGAAKGR